MCAVMAGGPVPEAPRAPRVLFDYNTLEQMCLSEARIRRGGSGLFTPDTVYVDKNHMETTQRSQSPEFNMTHGLGYVNPAQPLDAKFMIGASLMHFYRSIRQHPSERCAEIIDDMVYPLDHMCVVIFTERARQSRDPYLMHSYLSRHPRPEPGARAMAT